MNQAVSSFGASAERLGGDRDVVPRREPKVLFVSDTCERTGPTNSLFLLVSHLRNRFDCHVLAPGDGGFGQRLDGLGIPRVRFRSISKWELPRLIGLMRSRRFDLVYGNLLCSATKNALIASRLSGTRFVYHIRSMAGAANWRKIAFLRYADAVIAVSEATARSYDRFLSGTPLHVVYNGVDVEAWSGDREPARSRLIRRLGVPDDTLIILALGNVDRRKAPEYAVHAMTLGAGALSQAHLVLAGRLDRDPEYVARLKKMLESLDLRERVSVLGFDEDVTTLVRGSDILVHTALSDPHPRAVVEAMAGGLPVVAFSVDGVTETVIGGETGILVGVGDAAALGNALAELLAQPRLREQYGRAGRMRASELFSARRTAGRVGDILDEMLAERSSLARTR